MTCVCCLILLSSKLPVRDYNRVSPAPQDNVKSSVPLGEKSGTPVPGSSSVTPIAFQPQPLMYNSNLVGPDFTTVPPYAMGQPPAYSTESSMA